MVEVALTTLALFCTSQQRVSIKRLINFFIFLLGRLAIQFRDLLDLRIRIRIIPHLALSRSWELCEELILTAGPQ